MNWFSNIYEKEYLEMVGNFSMGMNERNYNQVAAKFCILHEVGISKWTRVLTLQQKYAIYKYLGVYSLR